MSTTPAWLPKWHNISIVFENLLHLYRRTAFSRKVRFTSCLKKTWIPACSQKWIPVSRGWYLRAVRLQDSFRTSTSINFPPTPTPTNLVIVSENNNLIRRFFFGFSGSLPFPSLIQIDSNKHVCCLVGLLCNDSKLRDCRWWWAACFRDFTRSWLPVFCKKSVAVCHYQDDVEAYKSVHVVGYANPNPTELFRLATLFITGQLVFFWFGPLLATRRNLWNSLKLL